jgi:8-amino-7-oxononanoate synthase
VDEAHATGVLGPKGMGLSGAVPGGIDLIMGTFSKALGGFGAYIACSAPMRDYLVNRSAGFIYSTALPPGVLGAMDAALDLVPGMDAERARLHAHAAALRRALAQAGISAAGSSTQIVPAVIGGTQAALAASRLLEESGILAIAIRPPTVAEGTSRLRFAMTSAHTDEDIRALTALIPEIAP